MLKKDFKNTVDQKGEINVGPSSAISVCYISIPVWIMNRMACQTSSPVPHCLSRRATPPGQTSSTWQDQHACRICSGVCFDASHLHIDFTGYRPRMVMFSPGLLGNLSTDYNPMPRGIQIIQLMEMFCALLQVCIILIQVPLDALSNSITWLNLG